MGITLLLFLGAVQTSHSQKRIFGHGVNDGELTGFSEKTWGSSGSPAAGNELSQNDGLYDGQNWIPIQAKYPGHSLATLIETARHAIVIDRKIPINLFDITGMNVEQKSNGYLFRIHSTKQLPDFESWLKPIGEDTWLYMTLADAQADVEVFEDFKLTAFVKKVLIFQSATSVQLTFMLKGQVNSVSIIPAEGSWDIFVLLSTPTEEEIANNKAR